MTVGEALDQLEAAVAVVDAACRAPGLGAEDLDSALPRLWALQERLGVTTTHVVGEWDARGRFRLDGSRSASARLARDVGCSAATARRIVRRARYLRRFRSSGEAFGRGELTADKVDVLARTAIPARRALFADAEPALLSDAKRLSSDDLARVAAYWGDVADDHLGRDRSKGQFDQRRLSLSRTLDGSTAVEGRLDTMSGAIVSGELDRIAQELFEDDWALARAEFGEGATVDLLPRSATQRRADALRIMATRSAAMPEGSKVLRPLVVIHCDEETGRRFCVLEDGTPVAPGALVPWWTHADFERVVHAPPGRVIDVGRRTRFFRGGLRRAIEVRDMHCTFPGCTVPAAQCDVDHIVEYGRGGLTTQANGRLRCPTHNRQRPGRPRPPDASPDDPESDPPGTGPSDSGRPDGGADVGPPGRGPGPTRRVPDRDIGRTMNGGHADVEAVGGIPGEPRPDAVEARDHDPP